MSPKVEEFLNSDACTCYSLRSFPGFKGEQVEIKGGTNAGGTRELKAVGRHEWRMATAPLDKAADGSALPSPSTGGRASHEVYVTQWNDSSKTKDVRVASTCLFGETYETTIGRKLKAEELAKQPELGSVGDKVRCQSHASTRPQLDLTPSEPDRF